MTNKTLIVYASRHGSSEKAAKMLKNQLKSDVDLINLKKKKKVELNCYGRVIIGGSIHAGEVQGKVKNFIHDNKDVLTGRHVGLFLCCMDKEKAQQQFENSYADDLRERSVSNGLFGGEFVFERMNWFERLVVKKVSGVKTNVSDIDEGAIARFANKFNLLPL